MTEEWYEIVNANVDITQGDLIFQCPLIGWRRSVSKVKIDSIKKNLKSYADVISVDVVVLTQACDLIHNKVQNVILCPHIALSDFKKIWEEDMRAKNQNPSNKSWNACCNDICDGYVWNMSMINCLEKDYISMEVRLIDFREVYTLPKIFLESLLSERGEQRIRLLPPYREHLSQSFARFFMRVGLPSEVNKNIWSTV